MNRKSILDSLKPWVKKPLELIFHADIHFNNGEDFDKRLALISYDNAIEVSISVYLNLHPEQRDGKEYKKEAINHWLKNFHTKIDFFIQELENRKLPIYKNKSDFIHYHKERNEIYHGFHSFVPPIVLLNDIRYASKWVLSILFKLTESDIDNCLDSLSKMINPEQVRSFKPSGARAILEIDPMHEKAILIASLIGGWDEKSKNDNNIIADLLNDF